MTDERAATEVFVPKKTPEKSGEQPIVYYTEICLAPKPDDPHRMVFVSAPDAPTELPADIVLLRQDYEKTARLVSILFDSALDIRKDIFLLLHQAADRGLRGPDFNIVDGRSNLEEVQLNITDQALKIRDKLFWSYLWLGIFFGIAPLIGGIIIFLTNGFGHLVAPQPCMQYQPLFAWILAAFWLPAGASICVWVEFVLRMQDGLSYEQLLTLDPSRWQPFQRLLITIGISYIFAFLLAFNAIQIGMGNLLLNDFSGKSPFLALAVGGVTGLAFVAVRDIIFRMKPEQRK